MLFNLTRKGLRRSLRIACLLTLTPLLSLTAGAQSATVPPEAGGAFYYADGQRVPITVVPDVIGVLLRSDRSATEAREGMVATLGTIAVPDRVQSYPGGILVLPLDTPRDRAALFELAQNLAREREDLFARTGVVVRIDGVEDPLLLSRDFIVRFAAGTGRQEIEELNRRHGVEILSEDPYVDDQYLLAVRPEADLDALAAANLYHENDLTVFAHPNFTRVVRARQTVPNDPLFPNQWHHDNTGQSSGTPDGDIDSPEAWDFTLGDPDVVVAVVDDGFDVGHPDLAPNLWVNAGEIAGNATDDDGNGRIDDVNGWDFTGCDALPPPPAASCGDADVRPASAFDNHGTAVAGLVAARGDNNLGVSGACPRCRMMLIRLASTDFGQGLMFGYLRQEGADVSTNSWGFAVGTPCATNLCNAIDAAANAGVLTFFAMRNGPVNDCTGTTPDISSLASVMAISASSNQERKVRQSAFGNCMELLAPTHRGYDAPFDGTLNIATTDRRGSDGYNDDQPLTGCPSTEPGPPPANARDYTLCFRGTSAATPTTAGVAALALSADDTLDRLELQRLLQDTADKMEDSAASYATTTGFSAPASGHASHGWGRVNALEAVRVAAPVADGGRGGRDVFLRDNRLDWGNTERPSNTLFEPTRGFIPHYRSVDIKVDAPPYQTAPATSADFDTLSHENPRSQALNRVYVRVHNRGWRSVDSVAVKLHWAFAGTALPALPADFWSVFPADSSDTSTWKPLGVRTIENLAYSGASAAGCPGRTQPPCGGLSDDARIVRFDFPGPALDLSAANPRHYCLFAVLDSPQDPAPDPPASLVPDHVTPRHNNVTHRNVALQDPSRDRLVRFFVRNPTAGRLRTVVGVEAPRGWRVQADGFDPGGAFFLEAGEERLVGLEVVPPGPEARGTIDVRQSFPDADPPLSGGLSIDVAPQPVRSKPALSLHLGVTDPHGVLASAFDTGPAATVDLTLPLRDRLSADLRLGYSGFDARGEGDDLEIWDLSLNLKYRLGSSPLWWPFVNAGPGLYYDDGSGDVEGGYNAGVGLGVRVGPDLTLEATFNRHHVVTGSPDLEFNKIQAGLLIGF